MGTFYNRQNMGAACSPVSVGDVFKFEGRNCMVTKLYNECFDYIYINPALENSKPKRITFIYWQKNKSQRFPVSGQIVLKGGRELPWNTPKLIAERKLRQLKEKLFILSC